MQGTCSPRMIVVTVGTNEAPFDRLLSAFDGYAGDEQLLVQHGPSRIRPAGAALCGIPPLRQLAAAIAGARVVVTHAGVGSIMTALANDRRPVVVPRLREFAEAVDDHQVGLARRLDAAGLVTLVEAQPRPLGASRQLRARQASSSGRTRDSSASCGTTSTHGPERSSG